MQKGVNTSELGFRKCFLKYSFTPLVSQVKLLTQSDCMHSHIKPEILTAVLFVVCEICKENFLHKLTDKPTADLHKMLLSNNHNVSYKNHC